VYESLIIEILRIIPSSESNKTSPFNEIPQQLGSNNMKHVHAYQLGAHTNEWVKDMNLLFELLGFDPFESVYTPYVHAMAHFHVDLIDDVWVGQIK
jgi:hypothetical protein